MLLLPLHPQRLARRDQDLEAGARRRNAGDGGRGVEHLLEVVEHEERVLGSQMGNEQFLGLAAVRGQGDLERRLDGRDDVLGVADTGEVDVIDVALESRSQRVPDMDREAGLSGAPQARQRDDADLRASQHLHDGRDERRASNQFAALERKLGAGRDVALGQRPRLRRHRDTAPAARSRSVEALREQDRQVILDQLTQLAGVGERAIRRAVVGLNALDELREASLPRVTLLDVDELGHRARKEVLVLQAGDRFTGGHPAIALPVEPDEDVALRQIGAVEIPRRVGARAELEHHRREPDGAHRFGHGRALGGQFLQRGADEDPQPLVRRADGGRRCAHG